MCKCDPTKRTPFCGKGNCNWPEQKKCFINHDHNDGKCVLENIFTRSCEENGDEDQAFEAWWLTVNQTIGKVAAKQAWMASAAKVASNGSDVASKYFKQAIELLEKLQWSVPVIDQWTGGIYGNACSECGRSKNEGHSQTCRLLAVLNFNKCSHEWRRVKTEVAEYDFCHKCLAVGDKATDNVYGRFPESSRKKERE